MARNPYINPLWREITFKDEGLDARALITKTDKKGIITFASLVYRHMTKFTKEELISEAHSIVRHPFMPEAAFKDMWNTIKQARRWRGMVMNLRKDGLHYWVEVIIDPIDKEGNIVDDIDKIDGYIAIRREPSREDIQKVYELYKQVRQTELLKKNSLKEWERKLLETLSKLPKKAEDLLLIK